MIKTNYLFHFIITGSMDNNINYLKKNLNFRKNSKLFDYMIDVISQNISNIKNIIGDHQSKYTSIDSVDVSRIDKYVILNTKNYKILKKMHYIYNEYSISSILRDIIAFFYNGLVKYGVDNFLRMISKILKITRIKNDLKDRLTHILSISALKDVIFRQIIENLSFYV
ncbi:MAG: hypothetical protein KA885_04970 [Spirochaetes bacterium]|nr:hypothetical protein [Spirochaetota bacterium]